MPIICIDEQTVQKAPLSYYVGKPNSDLVIFRKPPTADQLIEWREAKRIIVPLKTFELVGVEWVVTHITGEVIAVDEYIEYTPPVQPPYKRLKIFENICQ